MRARTVTPELLDELPAADALAIGSRKDLRRLNRIMGHTSHLARLWREVNFGAASPRVIERAVEFGAGDATLSLRLLSRLPESLRPRRLSLVDRQTLISAATREGIERLGVEVEPVTSDIFDWLRGKEPFDLGYANLFLHHFDSHALRELLTEVASVGRSFLAVEPRRSRVSLLASHLLILIGCNRVTRHDAVVSVKAGFCADEISKLWPRSTAWRLAEKRAGLFSHAFCARSGASPARK